MLKHIHHVGVIVSDMERSLTFYQDILGLALRYHIITPTSELAFVTTGEQGEVHTSGPLNLPSEAIELISRETQETGPRGKGQVEHLCFSVSNIDELIGKLQEAGYVAADAQAKEFAAAKSRIFFFEGPDGETIELWEDDYSRGHGAGRAATTTDNESHQA